MRTSDLSGAALDWVVTKIEAERKRFTVYPEYITDYSTDWARGGPIIERENISVMFSFDLQTWVSAIGELWVPEEGGIHGPTPLVAAMRCYVASKLGDEVEIPEELSAHATPPEG